MTHNQESQESNTGKQPIPASELETIAADQNLSDGLRTAAQDILRRGHPEVVDR